MPSVTPADAVLLLRSEIDTPYTPKNRPDSGRRGSYQGASATSSAAYVLSRTMVDSEVPSGAASQYCGQSAVVA